MKQLRLTALPSAKGALYFPSAFAQCDLHLRGVGGNRGIESIRLAVDYVPERDAEQQHMADGDLYVLSCF